ncbi:DNA-directed DNA polymerase delta [Mortierella sp. AD094]|nr:DNA-directed DNA polymerase delta [Mortierella sp. AD094]
MSVLLYQNMTPNELITISGYTLDAYLAMNSLAAKLDHDYHAMQETLHTRHTDLSTISQIMAYCAYDAIALHRLNKKRSLIASKLEYIDILNVPLNFVLYQTVGTLLKCHLMQLFVKAGYLPQYLAAAYPSESSSTKYKGAFTQKATAEDAWTVMNNLTILDFASQYPSVIINYNISLETQDLSPAPLEDNNNYHYIDVSDDESVPHDVVKYVRTEQLGVIPALCQRLLLERAAAKRLIKNDAENAHIHNNRQLALKTASNTIYGLLGNPRHSLFDRNLAASVTAAGRLSIFTVIDYLAEKGVQTKFSDTDSVAVALIGTVVSTEQEYNGFIADVNAHVQKTLGPATRLNDEDILHKVIFPSKAKSYAKPAINRDAFWAGNFNTVDLVVKGPSWSQMTPYIRDQTESCFREILDEKRPHAEILADFKAYHTNRIESAIRDRDVVTMADYARRIRVCGSKSPIAIAIANQSVNIDKYALITFKKPVFSTDTKVSLVLPVSKLTPENITSICINSCLANVIYAFKRFFNTKLKKEEMFWDSRDMTYDPDMIQVREELIVNGKMRPHFNQYHLNDIENIINDRRKTVSFHEIVIDEPHRLFFDIESTTEHIDINRFCNYLVNVLGPMKAHIAEAHSAKKTSYHIVCDLVAHHTHNKHIAIEYNKTQQNICDIAVYSKRASLRMIGCNKIDRNFDTFEKPAKAFQNN